MATSASSNPCGERLQHMPSVPLWQLCGHECQCNTTWYKRGWTCPTTPVDGPAACGGQCRCQRAWMAKGWICWKTMENQFCFALVAAAEIDAFNVSVLSLSGDTILYIRGASAFTAAAIRAALDNRLPDCDIKLLAVGRFLAENTWYDAESFRDVYGTTQIQLIASERKPVRDTPSRGSKYREYKPFWCSTCQRHPIYSDDNPTPRCPVCDTERLERSAPVFPQTGARA